MRDKYHWTCTNEKKPAPNSLTYLFVLPRHPDKTQKLEPQISHSKC